MPALRSHVKDLPFVAPVPDGLELVQEASDETEASSSPRSSKRSANSSPPSRPIVSEARRRRRRRTPSDARTRSPTGCPHVSLTVLKWSRSRRTSATGRDGARAPRTAVRRALEEGRVGQKARQPVAHEEALQEAGALEPRRHGREEEGGRHRLHEMVVAAGAERGDPLLFPPLGRQEDDGQRREPLVLAEEADEVVAPDPGQVHVHQDEVRPNVIASDSRRAGSARTRTSYPADSRTAWRNSAWSGSSSTERIRGGSAPGLIEGRPEPAQQQSRSTGFSKNVGAAMDGLDLVQKARPGADRRDDRALTARVLAERLDEGSTRTGPEGERRDEDVRDACRHRRPGLVERAESPDHHSVLGEMRGERFTERTIVVEDDDVALPSAGSPGSRCCRRGRRVVNAVDKCPGKVSSDPPQARDPFWRRRAVRGSTPLQTVSPSRPRTLAAGKP